MYSKSGFLICFAFSAAAKVKLTAISLILSPKDPSYSSAYFLYRLNSSKGNVSDAIKYLEEAINYPESDSATDADYNYELAAFCLKNGHSGKAFSAAQKALELNPALAGKAYFLMGTIWGSVSCGGNEIERRAPYWVAVDYLTKAKNAARISANERTAGI